MIPEIGNQVKSAAECLDTARDGMESGDFAVLNLGHAGNAPRAGRHVLLRRPVLLA